MKERCTLVEAKLAGHEKAVSKTGERLFYTTDSATEFDEKAQLFWGSAVAANHTDL